MALSALLTQQITEQPRCASSAQRAAFICGMLMLLVVLLILPTATAESNSLSTQRQAFQAADKALQRGDRTVFQSQKGALRDYPLYPYLLYRDLKHRLTNNPVGEIRQFLATYQDSPISDRLRTQWLRQLVKEKRWADFLKDYKSGKDIALDCYRRQALLHTGRRDKALHGIEAVWMTGRSLPDACDPLFRAWQRQGGFSRERIWKRFGLAMEAGELRLARYLKGLLPTGDQATAELWLQVHGNPRLVLDSKRFQPNNPRTPTILLYGIGRWSRNDSVSAAAALDTLKRRYRLSGQALTEMERKLALFVASRGDPSALSRLTALPEDMADDAVQEWRVRTGLQRNDWQTALKWLNQMSPELQKKPQWQYWRARALENTGHRAEAGRLYGRLARQRDYHGFLAADRQGLPYQLEDKPVEASSAELDALLQRLPGLQRARELYLLGRQWEARSEWRRATLDLNPEDLKRVAKLAQRWGWHSQAIATLGRASYWDDLELRFPMPHHQRVLANARRSNIDPAWVYGIMRQESIFQSDAKSPAGALGLMQIMPTTGRRIAKNLQLSLPNNYALLNTNTNILLGTHYLRDTLNKLQGNPLLATAAYNAGPNRVVRWLPERGKMDADLWAETIPFFETRKYVKKVMEYATIYDQQLGESSGSLRERMAPIRPVSAR